MAEDRTKEGACSLVDRMIRCSEGFAEMVRRAGFQT